MIKISIDTKKNTAIIFHAIALIVFVVGISMLYINTNFRAGISTLNATTYEDSQLFMDLFEADTQSIFDYVKYRDVFENDGVYDSDNSIITVDNGPDGTYTYTVGEIISLAQQRGYVIDNEFNIVSLPGTASSGGQSSSSYRVTWRRYTENTTESAPGDLYMTLDTLYTEVLEALSKYTRAQRKFIQSETNIHFKVTYDSEVYTNDATLDMVNAHSYGRYAILGDESAIPDNNLPQTPVNMLYESTQNMVSEASEYSYIIVVDTNYPASDQYYLDQLSYSKDRESYFRGLIVAGVGIVLMLLSFIVMALLFISKKNQTSERLIKHPIEIYILLFGLAALSLLLLSKYILIKLVHVYVSAADWYYAEKIIYYLVLYVCALPVCFAFIKQLNARVLWAKSYSRKLVLAFRSYLKHGSFTSIYAIKFLLIVLVNVSLSVLATHILISDSTLMMRLVAIGLCVALLIIDFVALNIIQSDRRSDDLIYEYIDHMSRGNVRIQLDTSLFKSKREVIATKLNSISTGLHNAIKDSVKSERLKADLITNVSHDLKTPLTSIINYIDLIKRENPSDPKICEYLEVLEKKSAHLKNLTDDLVEASKASSGNVQFDYADIDLCELVSQANGEFAEKFSLRNLTIVSDMPQEPVIIHADGRRLWRVLENLYTNAYKYASESSRVYVSISCEDGRAIYTIKNVSENQLGINPEELTERFVRGDSARTSEGSGLGLSIATSLTRLQGGTFDIGIDGDLFKVTIGFG